MTDADSAINREVLSRGKSTGRRSRLSSVTSQFVLLVVFVSSWLLSVGKLLDNLPAGLNSDCSKGAAVKELPKGLRKGVVGAPPIFTLLRKQQAVGGVPGNKKIKSRKRVRKKLKT
uniref:Uncharacterized protein n=1 Tax=Ditylum brightwellii TaxID=49249 RepID=A0A7S4VIS2_9STRA